MPKVESNRVISVPDFDSGLIAEPLLAFGGNHEHVDPKTGLSLYGPYCLAGQTKPTKSSAVIGMIGTPTMIGDAEQFLEKCKSRITNDGAEPFLYPHFPGFNANMPFQCDLAFGKAWRFEILPREIDEALKHSNFFERIKRIVKLYTNGLSVLIGREPKPDVVLYLIDQKIVDECTVRITAWGETKRRKVPLIERRASRKSKGPKQPFLFPELDPFRDIEEDEVVHQNLRRGLKAEGMRFDRPTQIVWPRTLQIDGSVKAREKTQDIATRAWNLCVALYHKAGALPWRLAQIDPDTCFVGVSFFRELNEDKPRIRTSMAQAFTASGDGYVLRGNSFEWDERAHGRSPHLDGKGALALMQSLLDLYKTHNQGRLPSRLVLHKSSRFWPDELTGFQEACKCVSRRDFVAFGNREIQFYRLGKYAPLRGTYVKFNSTNFLLYTMGYIPYLRTYPGARAPKPIEIVEHHGDSPWTDVLKDVLSLTKLNWNTASFACAYPITLAFSQKVGQILAELPEGVDPRPEYRFYM